MDCSPPGYLVHGILQTRILCGLLFHFPAVLPNPGMEPASPALQADSLLSEPRGKCYRLDKDTLLTCPILWDVCHISREGSLFYAYH